MPSAFGEKVAALLRRGQSKLPQSVNNMPSNVVSEESGFGSVGASYSPPSRRKQRQPFKWGTH